MKDIYKNATLYYILVPIITALWPLFVWGVYLPKTERGWNVEKAEYRKAQSIMLEIFKIDPDRLTFANSSNGASEFDYANVVERIANLCGIPSTNYELSSKPIKTSREQKTQNARVVLKDVDIKKFANFLSVIQLRWAKLQCENITLTKKKALPDTWKIDLGFKYYY